MALTALLWLGLMAGIVGTHELTLRTGQEVVLETRPVDPRDLFRGDYVVLSYAAGALDLASLPNDLRQPARGQSVYVTLDRSGPRAVPAGVHAARPAQAPVSLRGRITSVHGRRIQVEYGIESYFVPEGRGRPLERAAGKSLEVVARVDRDGRAAIETVRLNGIDVNFR
jgi:uncharacterized membrane-anchored protein